MAYEILKSQCERPIRGVLFDMDGLVVDTEKLYSRFWREACAFFGFTMSYEESIAMRALNPQLAEATLKRFFGPEIEYLPTRNKRIELMEAYIAENGVDLKPGIVELLDYLDAHNIPAAITSASPIPRIQSYLSRHGLDTRFAAFCSGRDVPHGKPEPDIYLHGAAALGLKAEECMALEDSPTGILSAYRACCLPVMIPDLDQPSEETKALLYAKADSLADVIPLLENLK